LSFRRGLGVEVDGLAIAEDPRVGTGNMVSARGTLVRIRIVPALFGRFEIARVLLEEPDISIVRTAGGWNIAQLGAAEPAEGSAESDASGPAIAIALLDVNEGTIRYADRTAKPPAEMVARRVQFRASDLSFGEELRFELAAAVFAPDDQDVKASGTVGPIEKNAVGATPIDTVIHLEDLDLAQVLTLAGGVEGLEASGPLTASIHTGGTIDAWTTHVTVHAERAQIRYGESFDKVAGVTLSLTTTVANDANGGYRVAPLAVELGDSEIKGAGAWSPTASGASKFDAELVATDLALADLARVSPAARGARLEGLAHVDLRIAGDSSAGIRSADGTVQLEQVTARPSGAPTVSQLGGKMVFEGKTVDIAPTTFRIGGAPATLQGQIANVSTPALTFVLTSERLPLSALTDGEADDAGDVLEEVRVEGTVANDERGARLDGRIQAVHGRVGGLPMTDLAATLRHAGGSLRVDPMSFKTCGGRVEGTAAYEQPATAAAAPRIRMKARATDVQIERLTTALTATDAPLAGGTIAFDVDLDGAGADWNALSRALTGSGHFAWTDGTLRKTNIPEAALQGATGVPGLSNLLPAGLRKDFPQLFGRKDTSFEQMAAKFKVQDGRISTRDLGIDARDFAIAADGSIGLDWTTDLAATLKASTELSRRLIGEVGALKHLADRAGRVAIPFRMTGALTGPKIQPDAGALATALQKGLIGTLSEQLLGGGKPKKKSGSAPKSP
jgi:hypothetical protein